MRDERIEELRAIPKVNGIYRIQLGYEMRDGIRKPKYFYLGKDSRIARRGQWAFSDAFRAMMDEARQQGRKKTDVVWTDAWIKAAETELKSELTLLAEATATVQSFNDLSADGETDAIPTPIDAVINDARLYQLLEKYESHLDDRVTAKTMSDDHTKTQKTSFRRLKKAFKDCRVTSLNSEKLVSIRLFFEARPKTKNGTKMKFDTVSSICSHLRSFFKWASKNGWTAYLDWREDLTPKRTIEDEDRDEESRHDLFSVDELLKLYRAASQSMKTVLLVALNTASEAKAIATLERKHLKICPVKRRNKATGKVRTIEQPRIKRRRHKTAVYCEWNLWEETWAAIQARMEQNPKPNNANDAALCFLGRDGNALVHPTPKGRCDSIALAFVDLCETAGVKHRGFKYLRKTAISMVERISKDQIIADMMAGHSVKTINQKHYLNRNWSDLHRVLRKMRRRLEPLFAKESTPEATK